eukprot:1788490-Amphidinium_carterae.3
MAGWLDRHIHHCETQQVKSEEGYVILARVADLLNLKPVHYPSVEEFYANIMKEVEDYWTSHRIPKEEQFISANCSTQRRKFLYCHEGPTESVQVTEQINLLSKGMDVSAMDMAKKGGCNAWHQAQCQRFVMAAGPAAALLCPVMRTSSVQHSCALHLHIGAYYS